MFKKSALIVGCLALGLSSRALWAVAITSQGSGDWSNANTWNPSQVPTAADAVTIRNIDTVTVDAAAGQAASVSVAGTLRFSRSVHSQLTVNGGNLVVANTGLLDMGTAADPISAVRAALVLGSTRLLTVNSGGRFRSYGAAKSPVAEAITGAGAGATSLLVPAAQSSGWQAGDWITIGKTAPSSADETELRQITGLSGTDPRTVSWSAAQGLAYVHASAGPTRVANLTRNVAVRSSGGTPGEVEVNAPGGGAFQAHLTEFEGLAEVSFGFGTGGQTVSSCTVHHGLRGMSFQEVSGSAIQHNVFYLNNGAAFGFALFLHGSDRNVVRGNDFTSHAAYGVYMVSGFPGQAVNNVIDGNHFYSNSVQPSINATGNLTTITGNRVYANAVLGINVAGSSVVVQGNHVYDNAGSGIALTDHASRNWVASNVIHGNFSGVLMNDSGASGSIGGDLILANAIYDNTAPSGGGVYVIRRNASQEVLLQGNRLGYDALGNSRPDTVELNTIPTGGVYLRWRDNRVNPAVPISYDDHLTKAGNYVISYNEELSPGTVRIHGDHTVSNGTLALDQAQALYASSASPVRLLRGSGHSASVVSTVDAAAVTQLVTVLCVDGASNQWRVEGSETGVLHGPFTGGLASQSIAGQFTLTFTPGPSPATDDRLAFALMAGSRDAGVQKKLFFGDVSASFNGGKSRLTVAPGAGVSLQGTPAAPTLVDRLGSNPYTWISSGAAILHNARVWNADLGGLQLSGSGGVDISSSSFDFMGVTAGQPNAYITARDLVSNATFYNTAFGVSNSTASAAGAFAVRVLGADAGLDWFFWGHAGGLNDTDSDPNGRVDWSESSPPAMPGAFSAVPGTGDGDIALSWTSPGDDGMAGAIVGGTFFVYRTTDAATLASATPGQAQTVISTGALPGSLHVLGVPGLNLGVTQHFRLWAADEFGNASPPATASSLPQRLTPQPPGGFLAAAAPGQINLSWSAPAVPPPAYLDHYELEYSTESVSAGFQVLDGAIPPGTTSASQGSLLPETTYYYRLYSADVLGRSSFAAAFAMAPDAAAPPAVAGLSAVTGAAVDTVDLMWTSPGDLPGPKVLGAGSVYLIESSTDAAEAWDPAEALAFPASGDGAGALKSASIANLSLSVPYHFVLWTRDSFGNTSLLSNMATSTPRQAGPVLLAFGPSTALAAPRTLSSVPVLFDKPVLGLAGGFSFIKVKDRLGNLVNQAVDPSSWTLSGAGASYALDAQLEGNTLYRLTLSTTVTDAQGNPLLASTTVQFLTLLDHTERNIVTEGVRNARVDFAPRALARDGFLEGTSLPESEVAAATRKLSQNAQDPLRRPLPGTVVDLEAFDALGGLQAGPFRAGVTVSIPFSDTNPADGIVDGTSPPIKVRSLALYWLDEAHDLWVPLPSSVDAAAGRVTARARHFSTFALMAQSDLDLSAAHPFPVPFTPGRGASLCGAVTAEGVCFTGLPQLATIRIYTPDGRLVRELSSSDGLGQILWDARNADGDPAASGVYLYEISNGHSSVTGKLAVLR